MKLTAILLIGLLVVVAIQAAPGKGRGKGKNQDEDGDSDSQSGGKGRGRKGGNKGNKSVEEIAEEDADIQALDEEVSALCSSTIPPIEALGDDDSSSGKGSGIGKKIKGAIDKVKKMVGDKIKSATKLAESDADIQALGGKGGAKNGGVATAVMGKDKGKKSKSANEDEADIEELGGGGSDKGKKGGKGGKKEIIEELGSESDMSKEKKD